MLRDVTGESDVVGNVFAFQHEPEIRQWAEHGLLAGHLVILLASDFGVNITAR